MKIRILFKDPDAISDAIYLAATEVSANVNIPKDLFSTSQYNSVMNEIAESVEEGISENLKPWVSYGDSIVVEFDLINKTATVIENES